SPRSNTPPRRQQTDRSSIASWTWSWHSKPSPRRRNLRCRRRRWHSAHMRRRVPRTGGRMALLPFQAHHQASSTTTSPPSTDSICSSSRRLSDRALTSSLIDSNALLIIWKNVATRMEQLILERPHHARVLIVGLARLLDLTAS